MLAFLIFALVFGTASVLKSHRWDYTIEHGNNDTVSGLSVEFITEDGEEKAPEILKLADTEEKATALTLHWKAAEPGEAQLRIHYLITGSSGEEKGMTQGLFVRVTKSGVIFVGNGIADYTGFPVVYYGMMFYALFMALFLLLLRESYQKENYYSYQAVASLSGALFFAIIFLVYLLAVLAALVRGEQVSLKLMMLFTGNLTTAYLLLTIPFVMVFSAAVAVSNIELIRHEGKRLSNMLGILAGLLLMGGTGAVFGLFMLNTLLGQQHPVIPVLYAAVSAVFSVFQVMLAGSIISCLRAGNRRVSFGIQYIVILGCGIRKDGTLYPLIRGRVDRAIAFWKEQAEATGEKAYFVPSGGQGPDEVMPEAEAMKNYLKEKGIPEELILPEKNSANTTENMRFSKALIEKEDPTAKVVYSTTNYHVFRSGILAHREGLKADGIGSRTKWYFWPNALLREVVGMFAVQPKMQLLAALGLMLIAGAFGYFYSLFA